MAQTHTTAEAPENPLNRDGLCVLSLGMSDCSRGFDLLTHKNRRWGSPRAFCTSHHQGANGKSECGTEEGRAVHCEAVRTFRLDRWNEHRRVSSLYVREARLTSLVSLLLCWAALRWTSTNVLRRIRVCSKQSLERKACL